MISPIPNVFKVPQRQWRKWSEEARAVFNRMYELSRDNQDIFTHPKAKPVPPEHWQTVSWNVGWLAADAVMGTAPARGDRIEDIGPSGKVKKVRIVQ